ncbi:MAG: NUDIX hydrolase [Thermodesulfobacteriota bacterium]
MKASVPCPHCGKEVPLYRNPLPTVDIIIFVDRGIVLIERANPPYGWALPGGFIDYGESAESAAVREAREETSLEVLNLRQFRVYSDPHRDPRHHTLSVVFTAEGRGVPKAADDAKGIGVFAFESLPTPLAFDHSRIIEDYFASESESSLALSPRE